VKDADTANVDETWGLEYFKAAEPAKNWKVGAKLRVFSKRPGLTLLPSIAR
jgi:hypothetical protein